MAEKFIVEIISPDKSIFKTFFHKVLKEGVYLAPSPFESLFISTAHCIKFKDVVEAVFMASTRDEANAALYGESIWDMTSYMQQGWALTAKAVDTYGNGLTSVDYLQRDVEVRWVGEFVDEPITTDAGVVYYGANTDLPHSYVWISGSLSLIHI